MHNSRIETHGNSVINQISSWHNRRKFSLSLWLFETIYLCFDNITWNGRSDIKKSTCVDAHSAVWERAWSACKPVVFPLKMSPARSFLSHYIELRKIFLQVIYQFQSVSLFLCRLYMAFHCHFRYIVWCVGSFEPQRYEWVIRLL